MALLPTEERPPNDKYAFLCVFHTWNLHPTSLRHCTAMEAYLFTTWTVKSGSTKLVESAKKKLGLFVRSGVWALWPSWSPTRNALLMKNMYFSAFSTLKISTRPFSCQTLAKLLTVCNVNPQFLFSSLIE